MVNICVYASSSAQTPVSFLAAAARLGTLLAQGGHTCVNGGGRAGGMGALNAALAAHGGRIVGVIHKRWVVDEAEFAVEMEGGSGSQMIVVDGDDLTNRKRGLRDACDAIIVLPGGPGTWEEFMEVVALRQLGMCTTPICVVNTDGFYDGLIQLFARAQADSVLKVEPSSLLPVFATVDEALAWTLTSVANGPCAELVAAAAQSRLSYRATAKDGARAAAAIVPSPLQSRASLASALLSQQSHAAVGAVALALGFAIGAMFARPR